MLFQKYPPHKGLEAYINCYWTLSNPNPALYTKSYCFFNEGVEIFFNLNNATPFDSDNKWLPTPYQSCVYGPMTQGVRIQGAGDLTAFGVCFRAGGAYPFIRCPAGDLTNRQVGTSDLLGAMGKRMIDHLRYNCGTTKARIDFLNTIFLRQLETKGKRNAALKTSLQAIEARNGCLTVLQLAAYVGKSRRQLERLFKEHIGLSPKQLCRSMRLKKLLKRLAISPKETWSLTALNCGYYDQSHMIRDFKHYIGESPALYFDKKQGGRTILN